jgi:hypothetical protein
MGLTDIGTLSAPLFSGSGANLTNLPVANISGLGNISTINLDGNASNILYGNGSFGPAAGGGTYGNANVTTLLNALGSNTITTTGNVSVGNIQVMYYTAMVCLLQLLVVHMETQMFLPT